MKTQTSDKIIEICQSSKGARPHDLARELGISNSAVHRQLKKLLLTGKIRKVGKAPWVIYQTTKETKQLSPPRLSKELAKVIEDNFYYFLPNGQELSGIEAFLVFLSKTGPVSYTHLTLPTICSV